MRVHLLLWISVICCAFKLNIAFAETASELDKCLLKAIKNADENTTVKTLKAKCETKLTENSSEKAQNAQVRQTLEETVRAGGMSTRFKNERETQFNAFVITPHKRTYIIPALTTNAINIDAYGSFEGYEENLEDLESKFQISFKVPLNEEGFLFENDTLYLGFTLQAWWQIYADNISKPFRETNYQPELFYLTPLPFTLFGGNTALALGIEHQSNGRAQNLSRSWNRVYANFFWEKDNFALSFRPWYRLQEDEKSFELDPRGDDNPDIEDFMGHFELGAAYRWDSLEFSLMSRRNFSTHKGSAELGFTFPLFGKLRGFAYGFTGYGESLIDYNYKQTRVGLGVTLNDILY